MKLLTKEPIPTDRPRMLGDVVFQHHSPIEFDQINVRSYREIFLQRRSELKGQTKKYIVDRVNEEKTYKRKLGISDSDSNSFTYATIVGFHQMESATSYPGFTYYFKMTTSQVNDCLFGIVGTNPVEPQRGLKALNQCLKLWKQNQHKELNDDILHKIEPRIEVIIPFSVSPVAYIPEIEQRSF